jgi:hypothetical protein
LREQFRREVRRIEHRLRASLAIADIDEDQAAQIAPGMDPARQGDRLPDMCRAQFVAMMRAFHEIIRQSERPYLPKIAPFSKFFCTTQGKVAAVALRPRRRRAQRQATERIHPPSTSKSPTALTLAKRPGVRQSSAAFQQQPKAHKFSATHRPIAPKSNADRRVADKSEPSSPIPHV